MWGKVVRSVILLSVMGAAVGVAQLVPGGREMAVDAGAGANHRGAALAVGDDGGFATAWLGSCVEMDRCAVLARLLGDDTEPVIQLNVEPAATSTQARVSMAALPGGRFVVVWRALDGTVMARRFHPDVGPLGPELVVGDGFHGSSGPWDPGVVAAAGGFVVVWAIPEQQFLRRYTYDGRPVGEVADLEAFMLVEPPSMVRRPDGGFMLAYTWEDYFGGTTTSAVRVLQFDAEARPEGEARIALSSEVLLGRPSIVINDNGLGTVVWRESASPQPRLRARRLRRSGVPDGDAFELPISGTDPSVVLLPAGRLGIAYTGVRPDGRTGVAMTTVTHEGTQLAPPRFLADGAGVEDRSPILVGDGRGRLVAVWHRDQRSVVARGVGTEHLRLGDAGRFRIAVSWKDFRGKTGVGLAIPDREDAGRFWFFDPANIELNVKVLDGREANGHFWVFFGSLSNVEFTLTVTDLATGALRVYDNPLGSFASRGDTFAFPAAP